MGADDDITAALAGPQIEFKFLHPLTGCSQRLDGRVRLIDIHMAFGGGYICTDLTPGFACHLIQTNLLNGLQLTAEAFETPASLRDILPGDISFDIFQLFFEAHFFSFESFCSQIPTFSALLNIVAVISPVSFDTPAPHLPNIITNFIEKVAVMRDDQRGAIPISQVAFQPFHSPDIEMIGRLVKD